MEMRLEFLFWSPSNGNPPLPCRSFPGVRNRFHRPGDPAEGFWPWKFSAKQAWFADTKLREELRMAVREAVGVWGVGTT